MARYKLGLSDVDGVLADFTGYLLKTIGSKVTRDDIVTWDLFNFLNEAEARAGREVLKHGEWWRSLPVLEGAEEGFEIIQATADEIFWVTSPWRPCPDWLPAREAWLEEHFDANSKNVVTASKKYVTSGDWFIDDKPKHIREMQEFRPRCSSFLVDGPHNRDATDLTRMSWDTLPKMLGG